MKKIIVVEDSDEMRNNIIDVLEERDFETYPAQNGKRALEILKNIKPDLILADIMMPEMGGIRLLYEIKEEASTRSIPYIFISAKTTDDDINFGLRLGASGYITKPFTIATLMKVVNEAISKNES